MYVGGSTTANEVHTGNFNLSADAGSIVVSGVIDASDVAATDAAGNAIYVGGSISLQAGGDVILTPTAVLNASGQNFNNAGKGGSVTLVSGPTGLIPMGRTPPITVRTLISGAIPHPRRRSICPLPIFPSSSIPAARVR